MTMITNAQRIVILAPHTDDGEFGCGGTIARLTEGGSEVHYIAFSAAELSVPPGLPRDILRHEVANATAELGIASKNLRILNYDVRTFGEKRQAILDEMVSLERELRPDLVLCPSMDDTHQDHSVVAHECFRAFKKTSIMSYEVPWNNRSFNTQGFVALTDWHLERKLAALGHYKSQSSRPYATREYISALAKTRGVQIGCDLAECFEVVRLICTV